MKLETVTRTPKTQTHKTPLLFVHSMWHGAWRWDEAFLPYFEERGYQAAALSLRGHAGSEGKIRGNTIASYVSDAGQVAKTFDTPPVIIGHSMGGFLAQKYLETPVIALSLNRWSAIQKNPRPCDLEQGQAGHHLLGLFVAITSLQKRGG
jgi:alpha-beta hydrolase superfamily lysophospholipase